MSDEQKPEKAEDAPENQQKPSGAKKFFKVLGLLATLNFADASEYMLDGDTEN